MEEGRGRVEGGAVARVLCADAGGRRWNRRRGGRGGD
uniref:Uncharacterized protein n=1 Tax=Arundo donax TaxID=35708 RepID=A0A0A8Z2S0_ARUDO